MRVVSVVNYKGGVGKTTLAANLGAGLAYRGRRVLLIDLDPQASLTFSFFSPLAWRETLAPELTLKNWFLPSGKNRAPTKLSDLIVSPPQVNAVLAGSGGSVDMIASHQELVGIETMLSGAVDRKTGLVSPAKFLDVYRKLANGLSALSFTNYDYIVLDCPPNLHMMTKNAIVASDYLLIPSRPDYLSTNGINHLGNEVFTLIRDYNVHAKSAKGLVPLGVPAHAVVFNMVQFSGGMPIEAQHIAIKQVEALGVPTFPTLIRDRKAVFGVAPQHGVPAILLAGGHNDAADELWQFLDGFLHWTERAS